MPKARWIETRETFAVIKPYAQGGSPGIRTWLRSKGFDPSGDLSEAMIAAVLAGELRVCQFLLGRPLKWDSRRKLHRRLLFYACVGGHLEVVKWLIHMGADIRTKTPSGATSMFVACTKGHIIVDATNYQFANLN
jgi:hypothetical protein